MDTSGSGKARSGGGFTSIKPARERKTYLYTPFGGEAALDSAIGENMVRVAKGKTAHALIAPSEEAANALEAKRAVRLHKWKQKLDRADTVMRQHHSEVVRAGMTHKMRVRQIVHNKSLSDEQRKIALQEEKDRHDLSLPHEYVMAQTDKLLFADQYQSLKETRIANATASFEVRVPSGNKQWPNLFPKELVRHDNIYPSVFDKSKPLSRVHADDKLYVLGHGTPESKDVPNPGIYAKPTIQGPSLSPRGLVQHLEHAGLSTEFQDLRITACQSVPLMDDTSAKSVSAARNTKFLAPEFAKEAVSRFSKMTVTGYMGNGVTFPKGARHHQRAHPEDAMYRLRRSPLALKFKPL
ncbi:hypothetical protein [Oleiagrimonas soli]|uniref:Uncharacterized protein n=1 Tax=Oleiagrimonas soli TaxID=1543381 RepID=A0A099CYI1_9GAMM|nr:hypothetical protein [Oleiagrimonas soli]KGI78070.1 hypothetical protein LF63_0106795 [Oleiagrimonas soli]MBB6183518.1 hypothetical protein [Oleiagrimonas soli]